MNRLSAALDSRGAIHPLCRSKPRNGAPTKTVPGDPYEDTQLIRSILNRQRGGVAILTALGFMLFSVPLITGALDLAGSTNIDARVKTGILRGNYCGLAVQEYVDYLVVDAARFEIWMDENEDPADSGMASATTDICGDNITITVSKQPVLPPDSTDDPLGDPVVTIPSLSAYNQRKFQTFKTVSPSDPAGGDSVIYTITVINRDSTATTLTEIKDTLPNGFSYDCSAPADQLTLPGSASQDIVPNGDICSGFDDDDDDPNADDQIVWGMPPGTSIGPEKVVTLTFTALTSISAEQDDDDDDGDDDDEGNDDDEGGDDDEGDDDDGDDDSDEGIIFVAGDGTYCNEAQVTPGGESGLSAVGSCCCRQRRKTLAPSRRFPSSRSSRVLPGCPRRTTS